ncbi:MAG: DUF7660 family protein [Thermomicrobiales bacterium]
MATLMDQARLIRTREEFIDLVYALNRDLESNGHIERLWENNTLDAYLGGIARWTTDMGGVYKRRHESMPEPSWSFFAIILLSARGYE